MEEKSKKETKAKEPKKEIGVKIVKVIVIIIFILILLFAINMLRNYCILRDIINKAQEYKGITDYSYTVNSYVGTEENQRTYTQLTKKGDISKVTIQSQTVNVIFWRDEKANETLLIVPEEKRAIHYDSATLIVQPSVYNFLQYEAMSEHIKILAATTFIYSDIVDGEECYAINQFHSTQWYSKQTGLKVKSKDGYSVENGNKIPSYTKYTNWQIGNITEEQVAKPDLTGYTIIK